MCDQDHFEEDLERYSRRDLGVRIAAGAAGVGVSAGAAMWWLRAADAKSVAEQEVKIETPDGVCDAYFVAPEEDAHAAVLMWPDIFGLRPAFRQMGRRLAESGYCVLVVNPFYREQAAPTATNGANTPISEVLPLAQSLDEKKNFVDAIAFVSWLDQQSEVDTARKVGTMGYCMSGPIALRTAAAVPQRIGAAATFHGGGLVKSEEDSPHQLIPRMKADFLIAIAENDDQREPATKKVLETSFSDASLSAEIEVYPAGHGWCPPDTRVHNPEQAERAWGRLLTLFKRSLT